jgi:hypothetical protein
MAISNLLIQRFQGQKRVPVKAHLEFLIRAKNHHKIIKSFQPTKILNFRNKPFREKKIYKREHRF